MGDSTHSGKTYGRIPSGWDRIAFTVFMANAVIQCIAMKALFFRLLGLCTWLGFAAMIVKPVVRIRDDGMELVRWRRRSVPWSKVSGARIERGKLMIDIKGRSKPYRISRMDLSGSGQELEQLLGDIRISADQDLTS